MDADIDVIWGAHKIQSNSAVTIPKDLLAEVGLKPGARVHWVLNPDVPGTLMLIPAAVVHRAMPGILDAIRDQTS